MRTPGRLSFARRRWLRSHTTVFVERAVTLCARRCAIVGARRRRARRNKRHARAFLGLMNRSLLAGAAAALVLLVPVAVAPAAGKPDLLVDFISEPPSAISVGDEFSMVVKVRNAGKAQARSSTMRFYVSLDKTLERTEAVGTRSLPRLKAGGSRLVSFRFAVPAKVDPGHDYFVFTCLDSTKRAKESDEANNCTGSATLVSVRPKP
jgi:subtilase family serine protease